MCRLECLGTALIDGAVRPGSRKQRRVFYSLLRNLGRPGVPQEITGSKGKLYDVCGLAIIDPK
jgi:hypothetical protein